MNITIKATNTTLTPAIKKDIMDKLGTLEKFLKPEHKIHVEVEVDKKFDKAPKQRAEITIQPHGYVAEARGVDFYEALDICVPKIKKQLVKAKDKKITARR